MVGWVRIVEIEVITREMVGWVRIVEIEVIISNQISDSLKIVLKGFVLMDMGTRKRRGKDNPQVFGMRSQHVKITKH